MKRKNVRNTEIMEVFGNQLRLFRNKKNLTQEQLAFKAGISTSQIARIETGKLNTTISTVACLATALDIDPSAFFENSGKN